MGNKITINNNPSSIKAWEDVSAEYAKQVAGEVKAVVGKDLRQGNIQKRHRDGSFCLEFNS